jgi:hypothetical protein
MECSIENAQEQLPLLGKSFLLVFLIDLLFRKQKAQWFKVHLLINTLNVIFCFNDFIGILRNPLFFTTNSSYLPQAMTIALHYYHMLAYRDLTPVDWVHHILMMFILSFPVFCPFPTFTNYSLMFICGLPGGIDYLMLILVKHNYMSSLKEKELNNLINTWLRMPGIMFGAMTLYFRWTYQMLPFSTLNITAILIIYCWNGIYFQDRIAYNYGYVMGKISITKEDKLKE